MHTPKKKKAIKKIDTEKPDYNLNQMLTDSPLFLELARIEKALVNHSCVEALAWCKENGAALKKTQVGG
jgi:hypothetical protein